jgi:hypothetical protein
MKMFPTWFVNVFYVVFYGFGIPFLIFYGFWRTTKDMIQTMKNPVEYEDDFEEN